MPALLPAPARPSPHARTPARSGEAEALRPARSGEAESPRAHAPARSGEAESPACSCPYPLRAVEAPRARSVKVEAQRARPPDRCAGWSVTTAVLQLNAHLRRAVEFDVVGSLGRRQRATTPCRMHPAAGAWI